MTHFLQSGALLTSHSTPLENSTTCQGPSVHTWAYGEHFLPSEYNRVLGGDRGGGYSRAFIYHRSVWCLMNGRKKTEQRLSTSARLDAPWTAPLLLIVIFLQCILKELPGFLHHRRWVLELQSLPLNLKSIPSWAIHGLSYDSLLTRCGKSKVPSVLKQV